MLVGSGWGYGNCLVSMDECMGRETGTPVCNRPLASLGIGICRFPQMIGPENTVLSRRSRTQKV